MHGARGQTRAVLGVVTLHAIVLPVEEPRQEDPVRSSLQVLHVAVESSDGRTELRALDLAAWHGGGEGVTDNGGNPEEREEALPGLLALQGQGRIPITGRVATGREHRPVPPPTRPRKALSFSPSQDRSPNGSAPRNARRHNRGRTGNRTQRFLRPRWQPSGDSGWCTGNMSPTGWGLLRRAAIPTKLETDFPPLHQEERGAQRAGQVAVARDVDRPAEASGEGRDQGPVARSRPLERDALTDHLALGHLAQVVLAHPVKGGGEDLAGRNPRAMKGFMSRSMNTVQRSLAMGERHRDLLRDVRQRHPSRPACSSMKLPVPAAQTVFMRPRSPCRALGGELRVLPADLEDGVDSGSSAQAARACAVISSTTISAFTIGAMNFLAAVAATPRKRKLTPEVSWCDSTASQSACTAVRGDPSVRV